MLLTRVHKRFQIQQGAEIVYPPVSEEGETYYPSAQRITSNTCEKKRILLNRSQHVLPILVNHCDLNHLLMLGESMFNIPGLWVCCSDGDVLNAEKPQSFQHGWNQTERNPLFLFGHALPTVVAVLVVERSRWKSASGGYYAQTSISLSLSLYNSRKPLRRGPLFFLAHTSHAILPCPSALPLSHLHIFHCFLFHG